MFEQIKEIIVTEIGCDPAVLTPDAKLQEDIGADSLDLLAIITAIEEEYGIQADDEEMQKIQTLQNVVDFVETHI